jgi:hypothetical protein
MNPDEAKTSKTTQGKYSIDFSKSKEASDLMDSFLEKLNNKSYGKKIGPTQVLAYALSRLKEEDVVLIQEQNLTTRDLLQKKYDEYVLKTGEQISYDDFIFRNLKPKLQ